MFAQRPSKNSEDWPDAKIDSRVTSVFLLSAVWLIAYAASASIFATLGLTIVSAAGIITPPILALVYTIHFLSQQHQATCTYLSLLGEATGQDPLTNQDPSDYAHDIAASIFKRLERSHITSSGFQQLRNQCDALQQRIEHREHEKSSLFSTYHEQLARFGAATKNMSETFVQPAYATATTLDGLSQTLQDHVNRASRDAEAIHMRMADIIHLAQSLDKQAAKIEDIAFRTNVLALNAATEVARINDRANGFAAVAHDVRELAQAATTASRDLRISIKTILEATQSSDSLTLRLTAAMFSASSIATNLNTMSDDLLTLFEEGSISAAALANDTVFLATHLHETEHSIAAQPPHSTNRSTSPAHSKSSSHPALVRAASSTNEQTKPEIPAVVTISQPASQPFWGSA